MNTGTNYREMKEIIHSNLDSVELKEKYGSTFYFPVYITKQMDETGIEALELSVRSYHALKRSGYDTIGGLMRSILDGAVLKKIRNCGTRNISEIMERLFLYQYYSLKPEKREAYLIDMVKRNERRKRNPAEE